MLHFQCPHCNGQFQVDPGMGGSEVICPDCRRRAIVPVQQPPSHENEPLNPPAIPAYQPPELPHVARSANQVGDRQSPQEHIPAPPGPPVPPPAPPESPPQSGDPWQPPPLPQTVTEPDKEAAPPTPAGADVANSSISHVPAPDPMAPVQTERVGETNSPSPADVDVPDPMAPAKTVPVAAPDSPSSAAAAADVVGLSFPAVTDTPSEDRVQIQDRPKTIEHKGRVIVLRRLTPEEKARRRFRRNLIVALLNGLILILYLLYAAGVFEF